MNGDKIAVLFLEGFTIRCLNRNMRYRRTVACRPVFVDSQFVAGIVFKAVPKLQTNLRALSSRHEKMCVSLKCMRTYSWYCGGIVKVGESM